MGVATSPGQIIMLKPMVIRVLFGSYFWGRTSHTTFVYVIYFLLFSGTSSYRMILNVSVLNTRCFLRHFSPVPIPWKRRPSSLQ